MELADQADAVKAKDQNDRRLPLEPEIGGTVGEERGGPGVKGNGQLGWQGGQVRQTRAEGGGGGGGFFFSSRRRHTSYIGAWSSDVCSSDLPHQWPAHNPACLASVRNR